LGAFLESRGGTSAKHDERGVVEEIGRSWQANVRGAAMPVALDHTIVHAHDPHACAALLAEILGRPAPVRFGPFHGVELDNGVTLDFMQADGDITAQHYAFIVSEPEFDAIFARVVERGLPYWADPGHHQPGRINRRDGGRGVYWDDPNGHNLEILTRPYGSGP
jgi:hypothetical protein